MEEPAHTFPFLKLVRDKYLTLEVLMYLEYSDACKFMFSVNKAGRIFLETHLSIIRNGFINDGLIEYKIEDGFNCYQQLERLYFEVLKRNSRNRILTLVMSLNDKGKLDVLRWINN